MKQKISSYLRNSNGILITLLVFALFMVFSLYVFDYTGNSITHEQADLLQSSLYSAAVSCYAVSGRYPTLEEIENDYGIVIDNEHFNVYYSSFASNIIPEIRVTLIEEAER